MQLDALNRIGRKIFGSKNDRELQPPATAGQIDRRFRAGAGSRIQRPVAPSHREWKEKISAIEDPEEQAGALDDAIPEVFAVVREAGKRALGQRHFDVQLIGGVVLHQGRIAEMKTGEGKTLVATLPVYLNALAGTRRARRHGQRLPGPARRGVDGQDLRLPRA